MTEFEGILKLIDRYGLPLVTIVVVTIALSRRWIVLGWTFTFIEELRLKQTDELKERLKESIEGERAQTLVYDRLASALEERNKLELERSRRSRS